MELSIGPKRERKGFLEKSDAEKIFYKFARVTPEEKRAEVINMEEVLEMIKLEPGLARDAIFQWDKKYLTDEVQAVIGRQYENNPEAAYKVFKELTDKGHFSSGKCLITLRKILQRSVASDKHWDTMARKYWENTYRVRDDKE